MHSTGNITPFFPKPDPYYKQHLPGQVLYLRLTIALLWSHAHVIVALDDLGFLPSHATIKPSRITLRIMICSVAMEFAIMHHTIVHHRWRHC
jgi:hypothetical protein